MASIRTVRALSAIASLPLAAVLLAGVAQADSGSFAGNGSNASVAALVGSAFGGRHHGNPTTTQQVATGSGASNQNNTANVSGSGFTVVDQSDGKADYTGWLWW